MKIFVINGFPRSGKDTFVDFCKEYTGTNSTGSCLNISTVDMVKRIAKECGWDGEKTQENRRFLSDLKDLLTNFNDSPFQDCLESIDKFVSLFNQNRISTQNIYVFVHCREPEEIQRWKDEYGAKALLIERPIIDKNRVFSNHADCNVLDIEYDYSIVNDGTLEDLQKKANSFIINIENEKWYSTYNGLGYFWDSEDYMEERTTNICMDM